MQAGDETTYQCRLSHPQSLQSLSKTSLLGRDVDTEQQRFDLEASAKCEKSNLKSLNYTLESWTRIRDAVDVTTLKPNQMAEDTCYRVQERGGAPTRCRRLVIGREVEESELHKELPYLAKFFAPLLPLRSEFKRTARFCIR